MGPLLTIDLIQPALLALGGIALLWFPQRHRIEAERRHAARLAELDAGAKEAFFEERRSLLAYRPARSDRTWQLLGALLLTMGVFRAFTLLAA